MNSFFHFYPRKSFSQTSWERESLNLLSRGTAFRGFSPKTALNQHTLQHFLPPPPVPASSSKAISPTGTSCLLSLAPILPTLNSWSRLPAQPEPPWGRGMVQGMLAGILGLGWARPGARGQQKRSEPLLLPLGRQQNTAAKARGSQERQPEISHPSWAQQAQTEETN